MQLSPSLFKDIKNFLLDLVFPRHCLGCGLLIGAKSGSLVCVACFGKISLNPGIQCHVCGLRNPEGTCRKCRPKTALRGIYSAGFYHDPVLREMIHHFKYNSIESLQEPLAELLIAYIKKERLADKLKNSILVPVPLALRRKISRGFNQSELLALKISGYLNLPVVNLLKRKKAAAPQAQIAGWQKRKENIAGAFCLKSDFGEILKSDFAEIKKVFLIDDVSTSGATLEEAAKVLKEAGVEEIYGLVIAKG